MKISSFIKSILEKNTILISTIILLILILIISYIYYFINVNPKEYIANIEVLRENENFDRKEELLKDSFVVFKNDIYIFEVIIEKSEYIKKPYEDFVIGRGVGYYINYDIIIKEKDSSKAYILKTKLHQDEDNLLILKGSIKSKYVSSKTYLLGIYETNYRNDINETYSNLHFLDKEYNL